mgnify:CR=1 FL=1
MILLIDNYDSFSYNLYQLVGELDASVRVIRNDEMTISDIRDMKPERILISPGPGRPENAGMIVEAAAEVFDRVADPQLLIRRLNVTANRLMTEADAAKRENGPEQLDLFTDYEAREREREKQKAEQETEKKMQQALIGIKKKYGKNAILKGVSLKDGATGRERNDQIGGHKA